MQSVTSMNYLPTKRNQFVNYYYNFRLNKYRIFFLEKQRFFVANKYNTILLKLRQNLIIFNCWGSNFCRNDE